LLQKSREGQIPKGAVYVGTKELVEGDLKHTDTFYLLPGEKEETTKTIEKKAPKYQGAGPMDKSGMPIGLRTSVDSQKEWYRKMYKSLHETGKQKETKNSYKPTYVFPESESEPEKEDSQSKDRRSTASLDRYASLDRSTGSKGSPKSPTRDRIGSWSPPHARYRNEVYRNQPRSIVDYEPGYSSIAFKEGRTDEAENESQLYNPPIEKPGQYSKYTVKDHYSEPDIRKKDRPQSPSDEDSRTAYKQIQKGGEIPASGLRLPYPEKRERAYVRKNEAEAERRHHHSTSDLPRSPSNTLDRRKREEDAARRREQMERIYAEERKRRLAEEQAQNEARRHSDYFTPAQKSPIPAAEQRFEEVMDASSLQRPKKKVGTQVRGKAKALYHFAAQNPRELQFRRGDTIYLLRRIDQNWYEGEHHGRIGIFPANYVEVITSLEDAQEAAFMREGMAKARFNFSAQTSVELPLKKGDTVFLIRRVDENWYEGRLSSGRQGIFPVSYVDVGREPDTPLMTPIPSYTNTPMTGSPGPLSPVSTISNGPAPTIPDAPMSPRGFDQFDLNQQFGYGSRPQSQLSQPIYRNEISPTINRKTPNPYESRNGLSSRGYHDRQDGLAYGDRRSPAFGYRDGSSLGSYGSSIGPSSYGRQNSSSRGPKDDDQPRYPVYRAVYTYIPQNEDELELREGDIVHVMEKCDDGWFVGTSERSKEFGTFPGNYVASM
jgi:hypothetical protein